MLHIKPEGGGEFSMDFFKKYVKEQKRAIAAVLGICVIFGVIFAIYGIPLAAVIYPAVLSLALMLALLFAGMLKEKRRHGLVQEAMLRKELLDETSLPPALTVIEEDYRELVRMLQQERIDALTALNVKYDKLSEYYTLWAHQIKTPIASMRLKLAGADSELVRAINSDLLRIEQYVDMVMTYVRLDSDSTDYHFRKCNLKDIIRSNVRKFSSDFIAKKLSLEFEPVDLEVLTDEKWLGFVVEQLLSNAVKYTQKGSIRIVETESEKGPVISISDTGMGISAENLPRVFELGFTGYNGRTNNRASGIGLYLCKRICDSLGVDIEVESTVGEGTTVRLTIKNEGSEIYE